MQIEHEKCKVCVGEVTSTWDLVWDVVVEVSGLATMD